MIHFKIAFEMKTIQIIVFAYLVRILKSEKLNRVQLVVIFNIKISINFV